MRALRPLALVADTLEPAGSDVTVDLPLVDPGFDTLYKPGSTTVTATIPNQSTTEGFGHDYPVENLNDLTVCRGRLFRRDPGRRSLCRVGRSARCNGSQASGLLPR